MGEPPRQLTASPVDPPPAGSDDGLAVSAQVFGAVTLLPDQVTFVWLAGGVEPLALLATT